MENITFPKAVDEIIESTVISDVSPSAPIKTANEQKVKDEEQSTQFSQEELYEAANELAQGMNKVAQVFKTSLSFSVDDTTGRSIIEVVDKESKEVIRQIPPKQLLKLVGNMRNVMGMLLDVEM